MRRELAFHPPPDPLIDRLPIDVRSRPRFAIERAGPPVEYALAPYPEARMILTVHDELLFEVPAARADEFSEIVRDKMQGAAALNVPLTVDVGVGENWKDAKD